MNSTVWDAVNTYYRALWTHFSLERLSDVFDDDVVAKHAVDGDRQIIGKELVLKRYKVSFFDTCDIASTRILSVHMHPHSENSVRVSYTIRQRHNDSRGTRVGSYSELLEVSPVTHKIVYVEMTPTLKNDIDEAK